MGSKLNEKELYIVRTIKEYEEDAEYEYVVRAGSYHEAIDIARKRSSSKQDFEANLASNMYVWE